MKKMVLNPNRNLVAAIMNRMELMDGFCPCKPEEIGNEEYRCRCKKFREEQICCCNLFVEEECTSP